MRYTSLSSGEWGLGGMRSKLSGRRKVTVQGTPVIVANGRREGVLKELIKGKPWGTLSLPQKQSLSRKKHWIAFTLKPRGEIVLDEGARKALVEKGKSLLPSGIVAVRGRFGWVPASVVWIWKGSGLPKGWSIILPRTW